MTPAQQAPTPSPLSPLARCEPNLVDQITPGARSLEVRWIFPGQLETAVAEWFGRFAAETQSREDIYLLDPQLRGLSVKVRAGATLEVKVYRGSPGILDLPGRACGRMEYWQKWSFPFSPLHRDSDDLIGWKPVRKRRRISRFSLADGPAPAHAPGLGQEPQCQVELTEVRTPGQHWWTLGFEVTGPAELLTSGLQATATLLFAQPLPGGVEPGPDESRSYAEWLYQQPDAERLRAASMAQRDDPFRPCGVRHSAARPPTLIRLGRFRRGDQHVGLRNGRQLGWIGR